MNPTTQQPQMQAPTEAPQKPVLPADQAAAHLGFVTNMQEQLLQHHAGSTVKAPMSAQEPQGKEIEGKGKEEPETNKMDDLEAKIEKKMEVLRDELKGHQKIEMDSLKDMIKQALENEEE